MRMVPWWPLHQLLVPVLDGPQSPLILWLGPRSQLRPNFSYHQAKLISCLNTRAVWLRHYWIWHRVLRLIQLQSLSTKSLFLVQFQLQKAPPDRVPGCRRILSRRRILVLIFFVMIPKRRALLLKLCLLIQNRLSPSHILKPANQFNDNRPCKNNTIH
jgi:hypothetical protein